ncbi:hypothetical protein PENTCL1PPCAC_29388, partial [Pristionchus entomophagus]
MNWVWSLRSDGYWRYHDDHQAIVTDVFCSTQLTQPNLHAVECLQFADDNNDGMCYQVGEAAESWLDAQTVCRKLAADLASIHNLQENAFVRRLAVSKGAVNGVFLGASVVENGKDFEWIDGTEWDYNNFEPGFPSAGLGDCLAMDTSSA